MTTEVMIINFGPDTVKIEVQNRDANGQFAAGREELIFPAESKKFSVHPYQSLQIIEVEKEIKNG